MKTPAKPAARDVRVVRVGEFNPDGKKPLSGRVSSGLSGLSKYIQERKEKRGSCAATNATSARAGGGKFFIRRFSEKYPDNPANPDEPLRHRNFLDLPTQTKNRIRPGSTRTSQAYTPRSQIQTKITPQPLVGNPIQGQPPRPPHVQHPHDRAPRFGTCMGRRHRHRHRHTDSHTSRLVGRQRGERTT
jgi:hypothetical protein